MKAKSRYEIKAVIARGGMGVVYRAQDKVMNRLVALKTISDLSDPRAIRMFQREWQDLASLTHPNVVSVFDVGEIEVDGEIRPYLVMPLLEGATLEDLIKSSNQSLTVERSLDIITQASRGLQAAHERGIVHRDVKPSNIFVMPGDAVKIIDFGVAGRLDNTKTLGRKGTLLYMSPEQLENKPISAVSDVFGLAVVCYETLARRKPFERPTEEEVVEAIRRWTPPPVSEFNPGVSAMLSQVIQKGMAKQPRHRFSSSREFAAMLHKALRNEAIESLNPAKIQARLQRAWNAFEHSDLVLADEIVGELEAEGHCDPAITELKQQVARALVDREVAHFLEGARTREEQQEYPLALQKIHEILQIYPHHTEALAIKSRIDSRRTDADIEEWFRVSHQHLDNFAYPHAREALQRILQLRPREPRAQQMLSEVDRREQNYVQLRQKKEELYRAALEAARNGEISQALSNAERILELDKQAPELIEPERTTAYQSFYNNIRSESESLKASYQEARAYLANRNYAAALAICDEQLSKYPNYALIQALRVDVEEQRRQALSARIADVDRAIEAESDLSRRVSILEEVLQEYPAEAHFHRALQLTLHRRGLVESIVEKARTHEERTQFGEAITQWETLQTIHAGYPGITLELERLRKRRVLQERVDRKRYWVEQIERNLERNEFGVAIETLKNALEDFPGDAELAELGKLSERGLERWEESKRLFDAGREAYEAERYEEATTFLRRAMELDDRNPEIRSTLIETLVRRAQNAHEQEPLAAEILLREALDIEPNHALAQGLLSLIQTQQRVTRIERSVSRARQLQNENDLRGALNEVNEILRRYPDDEQLAQLRSTLVKALQDERLRDLEEARRLERDADTGFDQRTAENVVRRLDTMVTRYQDDDEFQTLITDVRRRLQPATLVPAKPVDIGKIPRNWPGKIMAGLSFDLRSPWTIGTAAALVVLAAMIPFALRSHKRLRPNPVEVVAPPTPAPVPTPPEMLPLSIVGNGKIDLDGGPPEDLVSVWSKDFPLGGKHMVEAHSGNTGLLTFSFTAEAGHPTAIEISKEHDILAFLVSASADKATLFSSHKIGNLKIDGKILGDVGPEGFPLPLEYEGSNHKLEWMEGQEAKSREIQIPKGTGLLAQLDADPNVGTLVVKLNVPGTVDLVIRSVYGQVRNWTGIREYRSPLRAGTYTIEATPRDGFEKTTAQATIRKNTEWTVPLDFKKLVVLAHMLIVTLPGAHVFQNGNQIGDADDSGKFAIPMLAPGHYRFSARLSGYRDADAERDLSDGQSDTLQLALTRLVGAVQLLRDPANAVVSWSRVGDSRWETFDGNSKELPEGEYNFRAQADGYNDWTATGPIQVQAGRQVTVPVRMAAKARVAETKAPTVVKNACTDWPGGEPDEISCKFTTPGFQAYAHTVDGGTIEFKLWSADKSLKWQIGHRDDKNYWEFELTPKSLKVTEMAKRKTEKLNAKTNLDLKAWHKMTFTVKTNELRVEIPDANIDKTFSDPRYDFRGSFRVEVKKQPVSVQFAHRP